MRLSSIILAGSLTIALGGQAHAADTPSSKAASAGSSEIGFLFSDTALGYRYLPTATDPGHGEVAKNMFSLTHFNIWTYGTNFLNLDWLYSGSADPSQCAVGGACADNQGATEFYGIYRGTLGLNALSHSSSFSFGPIKDIGLSYGLDWSTKNNPFAPAKKALFAGLQVDFDLPGYLRANVHAYKEWNHNGLPGTIESNVEFDLTPEFEFTYMQPLDFLGAPLRFSGLTAIVLPKGRDGFGNETVTEVLSDNRITLDAGQVLFSKPNWLDVYVGYVYWNNKFGNNADDLVGAREQSWYVGSALHVLGTNVKGPATPDGGTTPFFQFQDTWVSYRYLPTAADPGHGELAKNIFSLSHFDIWQYGTNFVNLDWLYSGKTDPAQCAEGGACFGTQGSTEFYGLYRGTLGLNALSGSTAFSFGPVKDIGLSFGLDWNTKNNAFAGSKKSIVAGAQVSFDVPGYLKASVHAYKEWNHNGLPGTIESNVEFDLTPELEFTYMQPLTFTGLPLRFEGFTSIVFPKGRDGFGNETVTEVLSDNRIILDWSKLTMSRDNLIDVFAGYVYWNNKFGNNANDLIGAREQTLYAGIAWHLM